MKTYLVRVSGGDYDSHYDTVVFATNSKNTAIKYCKKYNKILKKWKAYYKRFETSEHGFPWISDSKPFWIFYRWHRLDAIEECYYEEVEMR